MRANMEPHEWESELRQVNSHLRLKLTAVEQERDEYKDEYVTPAAAYWELRRLVKWYFEITELSEWISFAWGFYKTRKITPQEAAEYQKCRKEAETALREAVE